MKRLVTKPTPIAGHVAAPGDIVCVATYSIQRDVRVWDNPSDFIPVAICDTVIAQRSVPLMSAHLISWQTTDC